GNPRRSDRPAGLASGPRRDGRSLPAPPARFLRELSPQTPRRPAARPLPAPHHPDRPTRRPDDLQNPPVPVPPLNLLYSRPRSAGEGADDPRSPCEVASDA